MLKPKHPCAKPGCRATCSGRFCDSHRPKRTSARSQGYNSKWDRYSVGFLRRNPFCSDPFGQHRGQVVRSTVTGHRKAHRGDETLLWTPSNHYPLCAPCNALQCVREEGGFGNQRTKSETDSQSIRSTEHNSKANQNRTIINNLQSGF